MRKSVSPLVVQISLAIIFDLLNGMRDSGNFVSTLISTHALSQRAALWMAAISQVSGPFIFGVAVANTFGKDLVKPGILTLDILIASLASAILWNLITLIAAIPSSSTHALVGGMCGAAFASAGIDSLEFTGILKILTSLVISPFLGLIVGFLTTRSVYFLAKNATPKINHIFNYGQILTGAILPIAYGANDTQKSMAFITMGLVAAGNLPTFQVPPWVMALSASVTSLGILLGGRRMVRALGSKLYRIRPVHGLSAQLTSVLIVLIASLSGAPLSSTQVVTSAILGAGSAIRLNKVRWGLAGQIANAWFLAIPVCASMAYLIVHLLDLLSL